MAAGRNATPLMAIDAVVIDTETTGLDARKACIVEIATVRLRHGRIDDTAPFRRLVQPGEPIPASATRIHGIDQSAVAAAPGFAEVWPEFSTYLGDAVIIGHTVGFDRTVIARECARIGVTWHAPPMLDTELLAQLAQPGLAGYTLENLAAWLGVDIVNRHSALGDATTTARIFYALIPRLRKRGIRTVAEAIRATRGLTNALERQRHAGWGDVAAMHSAPEGRGNSQRVDTYPYRRRVSSVMTAPAKSIDPKASIGTALKRLMSERTSSLFVFVETGDGDVIPDRAGIVTERDVLRAVDTHGSTALDLPVEAVMSRPLSAVPASAFVYQAIGRMNRLKVRHLGVTDDMGHVVGALSARDLLRLRAESAVELGDEIDQAADVHDLSRIWAKLVRVCADLVAEGLPAREIAAVISHELCEMTHRAAVLAEGLMQADGFGGPPCPYSFVVLGSAGRGESLLAMDQDNALIFDDGAPEGADRWFEALAVRVADILDQAGVPYCKGGVMAKNPQWRGSLSAWRERVGDWIGHSDPQGLLSVDIFFDLLGVHGDIALADRLRQEAFDAAQGNAAFAKLLLESSGQPEPGRNWFGGFRTVEGRIDLKKSGLFGLVSVARTLAVRHHVIDRSTPARLTAIKHLLQRSEGDLDALVEAQGIFLDLVLRQQIEDLNAGRPPSNAVEVKGLSRRDRELLRGALRSVENLDDLGRELLFKA